MVSILNSFKANRSTALSITHRHLRPKYERKEAFNLPAQRSKVQHHCSHPQVSGRDSERTSSSVTAYPHCGLHGAIPPGKPQPMELTLLSLPNPKSEHHDASSLRTLNSRRLPLLFKENGGFPQRPLHHCTQGTEPGERHVENRDFPITKGTTKWGRKSHGQSLIDAYAEPFHFPSASFPERSGSLQLDGQVDGYVCMMVGIGLQYRLKNTQCNN